MKKKILIALILIALLIGGVIVLTSMGRSKSRNALAAYKAQLRAQGEKLTFEEAGYPFPLETNSNLENFVLLSERLNSISDIPGRLYYMQYTAPGRAAVTWAATELYPSTNGASNALLPTWDKLAADCESAVATLAEIRLELEHPPLRPSWDPTNPWAITPPNINVHKRKTAQFLAADSLSGLHEHQLARAQTNLHALAQLVQVHRAHATLVDAMIRVAISDLALIITWEALAAPGWDDPGLLALQRDWEGIDLAEAMERGFVGERMLGLSGFKMAREADSEKQRRMTGFYPSFSLGSFSDAKDAIHGAVATAYWRNHIDEDEMFYIRQMQSQIETARKLKANTGGASLTAAFKECQLELERMLNSPLGKYRHLISAIALPNFQRAFDKVLRTETERRMTITVIALKRFHLRNDCYPAALSELVPQFIATELVDPWSGKPFRYRLNADGVFTLYSVGEDGRDNGGDPTSVVPTNAAPDMWMGKDVLWPTPVFPVTPQHGTKK